MILSLDNLAHRYHCLPSEALSRATTFDLYVLDVSTRWQIHQQEQDRNRHLTAPAKRSQMPTQRQMLEMLKRAKELKND